MPSLAPEDVAAIAAQLAKSSKPDTCEAELFEFTKGMVARLKLLEKARPPAALGGPTTKDLLLECKELQNRPAQLLPGQGITFGIERKATLTGVSSQVVSGSPVIAGLPIVPTPVRSLIPTVPTTQGAIQVIRKTSFTGAADAIAEGALKPQAAATVTVTAMPVQKIAVSMKFTKETYEDLPALVAEIETELIGDVNKREETELLKGSGTSPHLTGLYVNAPALAAVPAGTSYIDQIGMGIAALVQLGFEPSGVVVNGADWQTAKQAKIASGQYLFGAPGQSVVDRLWGLPVSISSVLTAGQWLTADFRRACTLYERETVNLMVAMQNEDDFLHNLVCCIAELREVLVIKQVSALIRNGTINP